MYVGSLGVAIDSGVIVGAQGGDGGGFEEVALELKTDLLRDLDNMLRSYTGGQMLVEGLQNADDAGATKFKALLDLRKHPTECTSGDGMRLDRMQEESFVMCDNGGMSLRDMNSLLSIANSGKRQDPRATGQFGLGSRSYFHYGDVIQVVSGNQYVLLPCPRGQPRDWHQNRPIREVCRWIQSVPPERVRASRPAVLRV